MPVVTFYGSVLPNNEVSSFGIPPMRARVEEIGLTADLTVTITKSIVTVSCDVAGFDLSKLAFLWTQAYDAARIAVDVLAFAEGIGWTVVLESFADEQGVRKPIRVEHPELLGICTAYDISANTAAGTQGVHSVMALIASEQSLYLALNDLVQAIALPHLSTINCGRALDGIRNLITSETDREKSWKAVQDALQADKSYLKLITDHSLNPRHGIRKIPSTEILKEVTVRTWNIMNRFLEYRLSGNRTLDPATFPKLIG